MTGLFMALLPQTLIGATSIQRRCASSAARIRQVARPWRLPAAYIYTARPRRRGGMNISHCSLKPLFVGRILGQLLPVGIEIMQPLLVRIPHRPGRRLPRLGSRNRDRPATAEPWVPSTWKVTRSSR